MDRPRSDLVFSDDEMMWEEAWDAFDPLPAGTSGAAAPAAPAPAYGRRRPPPRTLARDLAALTGAIRRRTDGVSLLTVLVWAAVAIALAGFLLQRTGGSAGSPEAEAPKARARSGAAATTPAAVAAAGGTPIMQAGSRGGGVYSLQAALLALGVSTIVPTGTFAGRTQAAVAAFQGQRGLVADGVVGPSTAEALRLALGEQARADAGTAEEGIAAALSRGALREEAAAGHRKTLERALARIDELPVTRSAYLAVALQTVAAHASAYDGPRALALFGMLAAGERHLAGGELGRRPADIRDDDGVTYRFAPAHGFQFHPIANFAHLNALVRKGDGEAARRLAAALVDRAQPARGRLTWEYYFPFGGPAPWTSAFAQGVAAQALARTAELIGEPRFRDAAARAFRAMPPLTNELAGGLWIREYSFSDMRVLNAQLQTIVSLHGYVELTGDERARRFLAGLETAARTLLPRFDLGCWSLYSLGGSRASVDYHAYHVQLLGQLAEIYGTVPWGEVRGRWAGAC